MLISHYTTGFGQIPAPTIDSARICIRGAGSFASCTAGLPQPDIDQLRTEFPDQAAKSDVEALLTTAPTIDSARICLRGAGSFASCTAGLPQADIDTLAKEFPQQATASGIKKKFFDVKNPMMWVAIGGTVVGAVVVGSVVKGARRGGLGLAPQEHAEESRGWYRSASNILKTADRISKRNRCGSIEHYTDAIAEGTVATVQGEQAMEDSLVQQARALVRRATRSQRTAVRLCRR
jgi:hypothetical protein